MKIYRVDPDGGLFRFAAMDPTKQKKGGIYEVEWTVCYKILEDGTDVSIVVDDVDEKHRGANEHLILKSYFSSGLKGSMVLVDNAEYENKPGFGAAAVGELSQTEKARQQEERAPRQTVTEEGPRDTVTV